MDYKNLAFDILESVCDTDEIREDPEMNLFDAGFIDSLSSISILLEIESKLGIKLQITDVDRSDISTVNNFASFLEKRCEKN